MKGYNRFLVKKMFVFFACLSIVMTCGAALASSVPSFPIGHLKVDVGEDGTFSVEARCVPIKDIIDEIARKTGRTVVYDCDVHAYGSITARGAFRDADDLSSQLLAFPALTIIDEDEGRTWRIKADPQSKYNPALMEQQILDSYTPIQPVTPAKGTPGTIDSGIFVYNGQYVPGPYKFETKVLNDTVSLFVNGLLLASGSNKVITKQKPLPVLPESGQFDDCESLQEYVTFVLVPQFVAQYGPDATRGKIRDFLATQQKVTIIEEREEGSLFPGQFFIKWDNAPWQTTVIITGFDPQTRKHTTGMTSVPIEETAQQYLEMHQSLLEMPGLVIFDKHDDRGISSSDTLNELLEVLVEGQQLSLLQTECLIAEVMGDSSRVTARNMALSLRKGGSSAFLDRLRELITERENQVTNAMPITY